MFMLQGCIRVMRQRLEMGGYQDQYQIIGIVIVEKIVKMYDYNLIRFLGTSTTRFEYS